MNKSVSKKQCEAAPRSGKLLKTWGPAQTVADTSCPAAAAPAAVTDYVYDDLDRLIRGVENLTVAEGEEAKGVSFALLFRYTFIHYSL